MQVNDDYIDDLFACKLGSMEVTPPDDGWVRVENELNRRKQMAMKYWLAAASFALLSATASTLFFQNSLRTENIEEIVADMSAPRSETSVVEMITIVEAETPAISEAEPPAEKETPTIVAAEMPAIAELSTIQETAPEIIDYTYNYIVTEIQEELMQDTSVQIDLHIEMPQLQSVLALNTGNMSNGFDFEIDKSASKSSSHQRWEIAGQFAPMQSYRVVSSVPAGLKKSDFDDAESPLLAYSGGVSVAYKVFKRLSIQTGVFYSQVGQSINNVTPVSNMYAAVSSNNSYTKNFVRTSSGSVAVVSNLKSDVNSTYSSYFNPESQANSISNTSSSTKYQLIERVDYLEIPLMLRYKIIDRKFSFQVLSGMSANVLLETNVFIDNGSEMLKSGTILMARPVNYSSTFGLGFEYQILKNLSVGLEPVFKYYLQSYTTSSQIGSNPYAFGVFTNALFHF